VHSDFILYDRLSLDFLDYPRNYIRQNFRYFFKHYLRKGAYAELIALFHFKFCHFVKVRVHKNDTIHYFENPYRERSRLISYPVDTDYNFFLTITYRSPFPAGYDNVMEIVRYNQTLNEKIKRGFKRMRDYFRRRFYLNIKAELEALSPSTFYSFYGFFPIKEDIKELAKFEANRRLREFYKYFRVYEVHKSNVIHCHALMKFPDWFCNFDFQEMISMLASWFETEPNGIQLDRISPRRNVKGSGSVKSYILKYMFKQFKEDNLFAVDRPDGSTVYVLKTSAFVLNMLPRIISYSRGTITKRFKPFSSYRSERSDVVIDGYITECSLSEEPLHKVNYSEISLVVDRLEPYELKLRRTRENNLLLDIRASKLLNDFLDDNVLLASNSDAILDAIYRLKYHSEYYILSYHAERKFNECYNEVVDF
jgi:hypothetical protein